MDRATVTLDSKELGYIIDALACECVKAKLQAARGNRSEDKANAYIKAAGEIINKLYQEQLKLD